MPGSDEFYDHDDARERYWRHRDRPDNPNDAIERPIFLELAGDLTGLDVVDLGCGDARFGSEALDLGANSYFGIDVSERMLSMARMILSGRNGTVELAQIEAWRAEPGTADLVASRLALNYVEDLRGIFERVREALRPGGRMILTVEHPVITSNFESLASGRRSNWIVDDYFRTGARTHEWLGREVVKYHRTIDDYLDLVRENGLVLERLRESRPVRENFQSEAEFERRMRIPLFLFIVASKPRH